MTSEAERALQLLGGDPLHTKPAETAKSAENGEWSGFHFITGPELDALEIPPVEWLVPDLIPAAGITLLAGPPKSCKTFLALAVAAAVSAPIRQDFGTVTTLSPGVSALSALSAGGSPAQATKHGSVLYFSPDDPNEGRLRQRLKMVTEDAPTPPALHISIEQTLGIGATFADRLIAHLDCQKSAESAENPPVRLVVVDTFQRIKAAGQGADRYADDVRALAELRRVCVAHPEVAILLLHHTRKKDPGYDGDPLELVSGTQGIGGGVDQVLVLQVPSDRGPARTLHAMGRDGEDHRIALTMTGRGLIVDGGDPDDPARLLSERSAKVLVALREFPNGATAGELEEVTGLERSQVADKLRRLVESGHALREKRGVYRVREWTGDAR